MRLLIYSVLGIAIFSFLANKALIKSSDSQAQKLTAQSEIITKEKQRVIRNIQTQKKLHTNTAHLANQLQTLLGYSVPPFQYQAELKNLKSYCERAKRANLFDKSYAKTQKEKLHCEQYEKAKTIIDKMPKNPFI